MAWRSLKRVSALTATVRPPLPTLVNPSPSPSSSATASVAGAALLGAATGSGGAAAAYSRSKASGFCAHVSLQTKNNANTRIHLLEAFYFGLILAGNLADFLLHAVKTTGIASVQLLLLFLLG